MEKRNGLGEKNKIYIGIFLGVFLALICPIMINEYFGPENASGAISYFGTLLGATATIVAVVMTIDHANKSNQEIRFHSEKLNHRNPGLQVCLDLIDAYDPIKVIRIVEKLDREKYTEANTSENVFISVANELEAIINSLKIEYLRFQIVYPNISKDDFGYIKDYVTGYFEIITNTKHSMIEKEGRVALSNDPTQKLIEYFESKKYYAFAVRLRKVLYSYELKNDLGNLSES